jgi:CubicO group peptidase (beta-lactamase class C family)
VQNAELYFPPLSFGRTFDIQRENRCVSVGLSSFVLRHDLSTTYCWISERLGCARNNTWASNIIKETYEERMKNAQEIELSRLQSWPRGDVIDTNTANLANTANSDNTDDTIQACFEEVAASHFERDVRLHSRALLIIKNNQIVYEKYKHGFNHLTRLHGWSMTKSILNTLIGIRIHQGKLSLTTLLVDLLPSESVHEENVGLSIYDLLTMTDGMNIDEVYQPGSKIVSMLFEAPALETVVRTTGQRPDGHGCFQYSSLASNYLSMALSGSFDTIEKYLQFPTTALFQPLGMHSSIIETDANGIFIASSFSWMTARDWARLGLLYSNDGIWQGERLLPSGWVDMSRTPTKNSRNTYGGHFWLGGLKDQNQTRDDQCDLVFPRRVQNRRALREGFPTGTMIMKGFEDQVVAISPESQTVIVRLGATKPILSWDKTKFYQSLYQCLSLYV